MAKPRIFVSSTFYDLKHIRNSLEEFIDGFGYDAVLFEKGDIPFDHKSPLDKSCYTEIRSCHILILIIGGRYGSEASGKKQNQKQLNEQIVEYTSITRKEYETARERDIPIYIFVDSNVLGEYQTFKQNRDNKKIKYAHVDNPNIFLLLDEILKQERNNYVKDFSKFDDIASWLRDQWAGLFAEFLSKKSQETSLQDLSAKVSELGTISEALKNYTESIMRKIEPTKAAPLIQQANRNIRGQKVHRLYTESMIRYLRRKFKPTDQSPRPGDIFSALEKSKNIEEFLEKWVPTDIRTEFLKEFREHAEFDFQKFRKRYLDGNTPELEGSDEDNK